jgi:hypothetical protein
MQNSRNAMVISGEVWPSNFITAGRLTPSSDSGGVTGNSEAIDAAVRLAGDKMASQHQTPHGVKSSVLRVPSRSAQGASREENSVSLPS